MIVAVLVALLLPAMHQTSSGGRRDQCRDNLKQIGLALHSYHEKYGSFPPAYIGGVDGRPMHSWRVLILPFLGEQDIYDEYRFDEPWNGPNNSSLAEKIVDRFNCRGENRGAHLPATPMTSYVAIVGSETAWRGDVPTKLSDFSDGTASTLLVVETTDAAIHWMEPRDLEAARLAPRINQKSGRGISSVHIGGALVLFADGGVRFLSESLPAETVHSLLTRAGGETVGEF
jgi:hypothetical protein